MIMARETMIEATMVLPASTFSDVAGPVSAEEGDATGKMPIVNFFS